MQKKKNIKNKKNEILKMPRQGNIIMMKCKTPKMIELPDSGVFLLDLKG